MQRGEVAGDDRAGGDGEGGRADPEAERPGRSLEHGPAFRGTRRGSRARSGEVWGKGGPGKVRGQEVLELDELAASFLLELPESLFDDDDFSDDFSDDLDSEPEDSLLESEPDFAPDFDERLSVL